MFDIMLVVNYRAVLRGVKNALLIEACDIEWIIWDNSAYQSFCYLC